MKIVWSYHKLIQNTPGDYKSEGFGWAGIFLLREIWLQLICMQRLFAQSYC